MDINHSITALMPRWSKMNDKQKATASGKMYKALRMSGYNVIEGNFNEVALRYLIRLSELEFRTEREHADVMNPQNVK